MADPMNRSTDCTLIADWLNGGESRGGAVRTCYAGLGVGANLV